MKILSLILVIATILVIAKCQSGNKNNKLILLGLHIEEENRPIKIEETQENPKTESLEIKEDDYAERPHHPGREKTYGNGKKKGNNAVQESERVIKEQERINRKEEKERRKRRVVHEEDDPIFEDYDDYEEAHMAGRVNRGRRMPVMPEEMNGMPGGMPGMPHGMGMPGMPGGMHQGMGMQENMGAPLGVQDYNSQNNPSYDPQQFNNSGSKYAWLSTFYEIVMYTFLAGFIFNCFFGKTHNDKYAMSWYNANKQYFEERYEIIGANKEQAESELGDLKLPDSSPIVKENPYLYKFYAAKYRYIRWVLAVLEFRKRTDAVSLVTSLLFSTKDRLIYEVTINPVEEVGWMFCVCKKRDSSTLKKSYSDIEFFGKQHDPSIFNERLTVLTENVEIFIELFQNKNLLNFYKSVEPFLDLIYYTDQQTFCKEKYSLFFSFEIDLNSNTRNERKLLEITHFVNLFADSLAQIKYNDHVKKQFDKNRVMFERTKMEESKRREIEEKEKMDFIEEWKLKNKLKGKKPNQKKK